MSQAPASGGIRANAATYTQPHPDVPTPQTRGPSRTEVKKTHSAHHRNDRPPTCLKTSISTLEMRGNDGLYTTTSHL